MTINEPMPIQLCSIKKLRYVGCNGNDNDNVNE